MGSQEAGCGCWRESLPALYRLENFSGRGDTSVVTENAGGGGQHGEGRGKGSLWLHEPHPHPTPPL